MGDPIGATQSFYSRGGGGGGGGGYKTQVGVRVLSGSVWGGQRNVASFGFVFYKVGFPPFPSAFFFTRWKGGREVFRLDHWAGERRCVRTQRLSEEGQF